MGKKKTPQKAAAKPAPMRKLEHKGYTIVQSARNHHIMIGKDGKMVYHAQADHAYSDKEMKECVDDYIKMAKR